MIEILPYILLMIEWHPDHPGKMLVSKHNVVIGAEQCQRELVEASERFKLYEFERGGSKLHFECIVAPSHAEQTCAFEQAEELRQNDVQLGSRRCIEPLLVESTDSPETDKE
jgi:hypothetical protein